MVPGPALYKRPLKDASRDTAVWCLHGYNYLIRKRRRPSLGKRDFRIADPSGSPKTHAKALKTALICVGATIPRREQCRFPSRPRRPAQEWEGRYYQSRRDRRIRRARHRGNRIPAGSG